MTVGSKRLTTRPATAFNVLYFIISCTTGVEKENIIVLEFFFPLSAAAGGLNEKTSERPVCSCFVHRNSRLDCFVSFQYSRGPSLGRCFVVFWSIIRFVSFFLSISQVL